MLHVAFRMLQASNMLFGDDISQEYMSLSFYTRNIQMFTTEILLLDLPSLAKGSTLKNLFLQKENLEYKEHFPSAEFPTLK